MTDRTDVTELVGKAYVLYSYHAKAHDGRGLAFHCPGCSCLPVHGHFNRGLSRGRERVVYDHQEGLVLLRILSAGLTNGNIEEATLM